MIVGQLVGVRRIVGAAGRHRQREHVAVAVLMLQPFAGERRPAGRAAEQEAAAARIGGGPDEVADALEAEHRIVDEERNRVHAVRRIGRAGGNPRRNRSGLGDALFEDLSVLRFLVVEQRVPCRPARRAGRCSSRCRPARKSDSMPNVRASSGTIGTTSLPISLSRRSFASIFTNTIVVDALRPSVPLRNSSKTSGNRGA